MPVVKVKVINCSFGFFGYRTYRASKNSHETSHRGRGLRLDYVLVSESLVPDKERSHESAQSVDSVTVEL